MKKDLIVFLVIAGCVLSGYAQAQEPFVSKEGGFSIVFPAGLKDLKFGQSTVRGDLGEYESKRYSLFLNHGLYAASYWDYPEKAYQVKSVDKLLSDGLDGLRKNPDATVSNVRNITVDGYPGNSYDSTLIVDGQLTYARTFVVIAKPHVYSWDVSFLDQAKLDQPDVVNFFKSFHVLEPYIEKPFASKDGRFTIIFPAGVPDPTFSTTMLHSDSGDSEAKQYAVETERGNWTIQYYDYPEKLFKTKTVRQILKDMVAGLQKGPDKKISNARDLTVDGFPAVRLDFEMSLGKTRYYGLYTIVIAKPRVYNYLFTTRDQTELSKPDVLKFQRSFHIQK